VLRSLLVSNASCGSKEGRFVPEVSNPTGRVLAVLNFLAAHPTETFTLAEIARHLGLSNGSAHRILTTMAKAHFLSRNEKHRTYSLGVSLVAIGQAAIEKHRGIEIARREISRLAVELNLQCSANAVVDDELLVLVKEGTPQSHQGLTRVGERHLFVPPMGLCHVAWAGEEAIQYYLARVAMALSEEMRSHLLAAFPIIRRRGYAIAAYGPNSRKVGEATVLSMGQSSDRTYWPTALKLIGQLTLREVQLLDITDPAPDGFSYLSAPVFSPAGTVSLQLVLSGMPSDLSARKVERIAERLCATAALITNDTHGQAPMG
jgi:DNA-binding IclR family transcriptional regulator